jgi:tRNA C32,U32 (ribose-2'-O)-methylase TrmJ
MASTWYVGFSALMMPLKRVGKETSSNEELSLCHLYARFPSMESFPSLNVAQAVMVVSYELFRASNLEFGYPFRTKVRRKLSDLKI